MLSFRCDECSALTYLAEVIRKILKDKETTETKTFGQPGSDWTLKYHTWWDWDYEADVEEKKIYDPKKDMIEFTVFNNWTMKGYKFVIYREKAKEFANYLDEVNQHMLENGDPI